MENAGVFRRIPVITHPGPSRLIPDGETKVSTAVL
jgi:hypothetical protein